ncbi:MAG: GNAT family N-acetyltransferase [Mycobacteriales bacterium]
MGGLHQSLAEHLALLVAEGQGRVIGVVVIGAHRGGPTMWRLYVLPEMHGRGVGTPVHEVSTSSGCVWCCRGRADTGADSRPDWERVGSVG